MKANAIVLCCTPSYIPYALTTLVSCCEHGGDEVADFHLVVAGGSSHDEELAKNFARVHGFELNFHGVVVNPLAHQIEHSGIGIGTLVRLFLNDWISPNYRRVLYLDSDLLAVGPVAGVFDIDMQGKPVAAVEDWGSLFMLDGKRPDEKLFESLGLKMGQRYFNAGVLLLDWPSIILSKRLESAVALGVKFKNEAVFQRYGDQDVLNAEFAGDWHPLPVRYNAINVYAMHFPRGLVFRHFAGPFKPWDEMLSPASLFYGAVYRSTLRNSPWTVPLFPRWRRLTKFSFQEYYKTYFDAGLRKKLSDQLPAA